MDDEPVRGELPERLVELLMVQAEVARAAGPWMAGDLHAPLVQLRDLGERLKHLIAACEAAGAETRVVYQAIRDERAEAERVLGRWRDDA